MTHKKLTISIVFLLLIVFGVSIGMFSPTINNDNENIETPRASDGEISIVTPENKTYSEPDSGYYPAIYGFENDGDGSNPVGWIVEEAGSESVEIIQELDGHKKVLELFDTSSGTTNRAEAYNYFPAQSSGTVEWFFRRAGYQEYINTRFWEELNISILFGSTLGNFQYSNDTLNWYNFASCEDNVWYHIRVDFECGAGGYQGLSSDTYFVYINGIRYGAYSFPTPSNAINMLELFTRGWGTSNDYWGYFDAIGYSWDPGYSIGDNLNEGLLLGYDNITTLDWQGYSLDGNPNKTILGNRTIPMPADGLHSIQVFGNDSIGTIYESELRYFTVNTAPPEITINSPSDSQVIGETAPNYVLSITGPYESIWYSLEGGVNYSASGLTGTIDQTAWAALSDGVITIDFYANNSAGMIGTTQVQVIKDSSVEPPPAIPGYNIYLLLGLVGAISILLLRKRLKS